MKHSEVLSRYVNTGVQIPEKQYYRLTPSLKKSYVRIRNVVGYKNWEFKLLSDDEKINYIEKNDTERLVSDDKTYLYQFSKNKDYYISKVIDILGENIYNQDIKYILKYSVNKDDIATKIIEKKGEKLNSEDIYILLEYSDNKDDIATKIIEKKGEKLNYNNIDILFTYSVNKYDIATKIIEKKGEKLNDSDINFLLISFSKDKEFIKKRLLQNGVDYKLINDVISRCNFVTPLIPDNYQSMLNEIRRIKEIMI